jgi:LCP family protein required for cell wall assembly
MSEHARTDRLQHQEAKGEEPGSQKPLKPIKQRTKKKKPILKIILLVLAAVLLVGAAYGVHLLQQTRNAIDKTYSSVDKAKEAKVSKVVVAKDPISILLLGTDTGAFGRKDVNGNSDTIIVATINPKTKRTTLTSVPRDTMGQIVGTTNYDFEKINSANLRGGPKMALNSVSKLLNVPLTNYVSINMGGLQQIVDAVGGVDVDVTFAFSYGGSTFTKGKMHLNGQQALNYARMRYTDPRGDYGRQERQRDIIESIIKSAASTGTLANFQKLLDSISNNVRTNLTFDQMVAIFKGYRGAAKTVESDHVQGIGAYWGKTAVQIAATTELQRVSDKIRTELGLEKETVNNETTRQNQLNATNGFNFKNPTTIQNFEVHAN